METLLVSGVALIGALQIVEDKATKKSFDASRKAMAVIGEACWKAGVVVRPLGALQSLAFSPPLTITREEADIIVDRTAEGLAAGLKGVGA